MMKALVYTAGKKPIQVNRVDFASFIYYNTYREKVRQIHMKEDRIKTQIKKLQEEDFMIQMNDHWSADDYARHNQICKEIKMLRAELEDLKKKEEDIYHAAEEYRAE